MVAFVDVETVDAPESVQTLGKDDIGEPSDTGYGS
jgi:hypothetical protein